MNKVLSFAVLFFCFTACDSVEWDEPEVESAFCFTDRETVEIVKDVTGTIVKSGDSYLIETTLSGSLVPFAPCNLPSAFKQANLSVRFSGKEKEIFPNEKWAGIPMELIKIKKSSGL